ncbi:MAG TPA: LuxR C-terminal-related transcriptional regulator [Trueperaceae bacterium]
MRARTRSRTDAASTSVALRPDAAPASAPRRPVAGPSSAGPRSVAGPSSAGPRSGAGHRAVGRRFAPRSRAQHEATDAADVLAWLLGPSATGQDGRSLRLCLLVTDDERLGALLAGIAALVRDGSPGTGGPAAVAAGALPAGRRPSADEASPAGAPLGPDLSELTLRELDVLDLVARGHDNATIAGLLGLSPRTVRNHLNSVFSKLNVAYRPQAVVLAREAGLGTGTPRYADRPARPTR